MADDTKHTIKRSRLITPWKEFLKAFEELRPLSKSILEVETKVQDTQQLQLQIVELNDQVLHLKAQREEDLAIHKIEIEDLNKARDILITDFQIRYAKWTKEYDAAQAQAQESCSIQMSAKDDELRILHSERGVLQSQINETEQTLASLKVELKEKSATLIGTSELLKLAQANTSILENQIGFLKSSFRHLSLELTDLQRSLHKLSHRCLWRDLPLDTSQDDIAEKIFPLMKTLCQSIAVSDSTTSKNIRVAAVEAIIAKAICRNIFRTPFHPKSLDTITLSKACDWVAQSPVPARCTALHMLLAASMQPDEIAEIVEATTKEVLGLVAPLLQDQKDSFAQELGILLLKAARLWRHLQRTGFEVHADLVADEKSQISGESSAQEQCSQNQPSNFFRPYLVLFPRIMIGDEMQPLYRGCVIWSSSKLALDAVQEAAEQLARIQDLQNRSKRSGDPRRVAKTTSPDTWELRLS